MSQEGWFQNFKRKVRKERKMAIEVVKEVAEIPNGPTQVIKVSVVTTNQKKFYIDVRKWEIGSSYQGPTKQGVWLHPEVVSKMIEEGSLQKAIDVIEDKLAPKSI